MPTTTRRAAPARKRPAPRLLTLTETLDEFSDQIDAHLGRAVGFADAVRTWRQATDLAHALSTKAAHRKVIAAKLDRFIDSGGAYFDGKEIQVRTSVATARRSLPSAAVEKAYPKLWNQARVVNRVMTAKHPTAGVPELVVPRMRTAAEAWEAVELAKGRYRRAKAEAAQARAVVLEIIDTTEDTWDGTPLRTADDWEVGIDYQTRFNAKVCRELAEAQGIDLSGVESVTVGSPRRTYVLGGVPATDEYDGE